MTVAAAKQIKKEVQQREATSEQRKNELVQPAGIEWLKQTFGKHAKPMTKTLHDKLAKACKCSLSLAPGLHAETCIYNPCNLKGALVKLSQDRASMEKQLAKTAMTAEQRKQALDHLHGPAVIRLCTPVGMGLGGYFL